MQALSCPPRLTATNRTVTTVVVITVAVLMAVMLFVLNPATTWFFPPCIFHKLTGLSCPACGSTRALHALLHGQIRDAFRDNALVVLGIPIIAMVMLARFYAGQTATTLRTRYAGVLLLLIVIVVFGVVRNIPRYPFSLFVPAAEATESK